MKIRPIMLPQDLDTMNTIIMEGFEYPDHPEWGLQQDEKEGMLDRVRGMKRMWPIMSILRLFSPVLRDAMRGFIAEQDGKPVGLMNHMRNNKEPEWFLANAAILPSHRRMGIARQLMAAIQEDLRKRHARTARLDIIDQNIPSLELCKSVGFEVYSSLVVLDIDAKKLVPAPTLPAGWSMLPRSRFDWRSGFELAKRITPENVARYEPPEERRFRTPITRPLINIFYEKMEGGSLKRFTLCAPDGKIIGTSSYWCRVNKGGLNDAGIDLDPAHPEMATFLVKHAISTIQRLSPGRRIEFMVESWQPALTEAAVSLGCKRLYGAHHLGMKFE
jgi:ribosomal protein S18 acetylase RimI-like enzyme